MSRNLLLNRDGWMTSQVKEASPGLSLVSEETLEDMDSRVENMERKLVMEEELDKVTAITEEVLNKVEVMEMKDQALAMEMKITMTKVVLVPKEAVISKRKTSAKGDMEIVAVTRDPKVKEDLGTMVRNLEIIQERITITAEAVIRKIKIMAIGTDEMKILEVRVEDTLGEETMELEEVEAVMKERNHLDMKGRMMLDTKNGVHTVGVEIDIRY